MLTVVFMIRCDLCGDSFEQIRSSSIPDPTEWALYAGDLQETAATDGGWFFSMKTRRHACDECRSSWYQ